LTDVKILLVEDSQRLQRSISTGLLIKGFAVDQAYDGQQALNFIETYEYDVIILDLMLPKVDGLTVLSTLRQSNHNTHVIILSAKDQTKDRIRGLDLGADDYMVKPFSFDELVSRIHALFRRQLDGKNPEIHIGSTRIDTLSREAQCSGHVLHLTPSEYNILEYLARRRGQVFSHHQLIDRLYDATANITKNAVEAHISALRKKLNAAGAPALIKTRRGFGYFIEQE